jgi:hypothetical protein
MLAAGFLGAPGIGYFQDYAAVQELKGTASGRLAYPRYKSYETVEKPTAKDYFKLDDEGKKIPEEKGFLAFLGWFPKVVGLDGMRVGTLLGDPGQDNGMGKKLETDIQNYTGKDTKLKELKADRALYDLLKDNPALYNLTLWWLKDGMPHSEADHPVIGQARLDGAKQALTWTAFIPAAMALGYLLLVFYFLILGGYKAEVLIGHAAADEEFTGGTEGPGEG